MSGTHLEHNLYLLPFQKTFLESQIKNLWFCGGIGTGKSHVGALYVIRRLLLDPKGLGILSAATFKQLNNSVLAHLTKLLDELGLAYKHNAQTGMLTLLATNARVMCVSMESYETLRGVEVSYWVGDEATLYRKEAYDVAIGRVRQKSKLPLEIRLISSPRGFDHCFETYAEGLSEIPYNEITTKNEHTGILRVKSTDNFFLPEGYIDTLAANYSPKVFSQEVDSNFVSGGGGATYYAFERIKHTYEIEQNIKSNIIYIGMDFNVNPMTAAVANLLTDAAGDHTLEQFDEIYLEDSNTEEMAEEIKRRYPDCHVIIVPDATGQAKKTSSQRSDHQILRDAGFEVRLRGRSNPHRIDRYNTVNIRLKDKRLKIGKNCKKTIRDLEQVALDKNASDLTHISDALGYLAWYFIPVKRPKGKTKVTKT